MNIFKKKFIYLIQKIPFLNYYWMVKQTIMPTMY